MNRDIGKMGESTFLNFCNQVDITANPSNVDRFGWDYILEFPHKDSSLPIDMQDMPIECKVQVKATDTNSGKYQIKLSAMHSLVKYKYPAFICFINYNKQIEPFEMFLVHIDEKIITQVLKSVRKNEIKNKALHKAKVTIHYDESHKLQKLTGKELKVHIEKYIVHGMDNYIKNKMKLLKTVGFDEQPISMKFTLKNASLMDIIDTSLGLKDEYIPIENHNITQSRFNLSMPFDSELNNSTDLRIKVEAHAKESITLVVKKDRYEAPLKYQLDLFVSPVRVQGKSKMVMKNKNLTFIVDFITNEYDFIFKFEPEEPYTLSELYHNLKLINIIKNNNSEVLNMSLDFHGKKFAELKMELTEGLINDWINYCYQSVSLLQKTFKKLKINNPMKLSISEIEKNLKNLSALEKWLFGEINTAIIELSVIKNIDRSVFTNKGAVIIPFNLYFQDEVIIVYILLFTNVEIVDGKIFKSIPFRREVYDVFYKKINELNGEFYKSIQDKLTKDLNDDGINVIIVSNEHIREISSQT